MILQRFLQPKQPSPRSEHRGDQSHQPSKPHAAEEDEREGGAEARSYGGKEVMVIAGNRSQSPEQLRGERGGGGGLSAAVLAALPEGMREQLATGSAAGRQLPA